MKELLSPEQLVQRMKDNGIKFTITNEADAIGILTSSNYYMKLAAYRKNYDKQADRISGKLKYVNLEFAYLKELSTLDMHLRYLIIEMCLDIEHNIKLKLLNGIENHGDDGYQLVRKFLAADDKVLRTLKAHQNSAYCKDLIEKYYPFFPAWVFLEVISFGELTYLCDFYAKTYRDEIEDTKFLNMVRDLRNASAHSNCLINRLADTISGPPDKRIFDFTKKLTGAGRESVSNNLKHSFVYNFIVLAFVYDNIVQNPAMRARRFSQLRELIDVRFQRHKDYFMKNNLIKSQYKFLAKVVDSLN